MMIRKAEKRDIPKLLELLVQVDMVHHNGRPDIFKGPATKYNEKELEAILLDENTPVFVYTDESDIPLGHAFCVQKQVVGSDLLTDIKTLYIDDICVDKNARGKHVGKALFDFVVDFAKENGFYNVTLNVWSCNPTAMSFYKAMGMTEQKIGMEMILSAFE
ncbi:MAG: GNAT family N-acetyltransferase [Ruminococcus sp.]|nr:GNAT family N-acetyltransferase [Ruminococcus sp.]